MYYDLLLAVFLFFLVFLAVSLFRRFFPANPEETAFSGVKRVGNESAEPIAENHSDNQEFFATPPKPFARNRSKLLPRLISILLLAGCGYYLCVHRNDFCANSPIFSQQTEAAVSKAQISSAHVEGHAVVDGINWFMIVATSTRGVPFTGWVSELAIQTEPPKENKMANEMMQKLGLPTNRERLESIKQLKKVGKALNTALKDCRPKTD